ncbi:hypothetical protein Pelo_18682 [Pelomyxa schiedti]|nr:hypothetical protein Pelo_18682 [Pelomyxa schiedti]
MTSTTTAKSQVMAVCSTCDTSDGRPSMSHNDGVGAVASVGEAMTGSPPIVGCCVPSPNRRYNVSQSAALLVCEGVMTEMGPLQVDHVIRDTAAAPWNQQSVGVPEVSLAQWEQVRFTACNRKWIVGCQIKGSVLYIHRVVRGSPIGDDVILKCRDFSWGFELQFTPLGRDVVMLCGLGETTNAPWVFVDLWESFNKKELVVTSKILYRTNWPLVATGATWLPDGLACILQSYHTTIADGEKASFILFFITLFCAQVNM